MIKGKGAKYIEHFIWKRPSGLRIPLGKILVLLNTEGIVLQTYEHAIISPCTADKWRVFVCLVCMDGWHRQNLQLNGNKQLSPPTSLIWYLSFSLEFC